MDSKLHIDLPQSPYQCGEDFILENRGGWISWVGAGRFESDHCEFSSDRRPEVTAADAVFRLVMTSV